jgi:hypothetical protein
VDERVLRNFMCGDFLDPRRGLWRKVAEIRVERVEAL